MGNFKGWSVVLALVLICTLALAGCGNNGGNTATEGGNSSNNDAAAQQKSDNGDKEKAEEQVTLRLYTWGKEIDYNWQQVNAAFEEKYPNIKIDLQQLSPKGDTQEYYKKLDLDVASGVDMDVVMFSDPANYAQRVAKGMLEPLDDLLAKEGVSLSDEYKVDTHLNGKIYALPGKFNPWYVMLNKDMLDHAGLPVPTDWTWDDFEDYARQLSHGSGPDKVYGTFFQGPSNGGWMEYLKMKLENQPTNPDYIKADGSSNLDDPNFKATLEMYHRMQQEGSVVPYQDMISQKLAYRDELYHQKAAMIFTGSWMNTMAAGNDDYPLDFHMAIAPFPKNSSSDPNGYAPVTTDYMSIAKDSKHKDAAYQYIRFYTTEGQIVQGKNVPSWNKISTDDLTGIVDKIIGSTSNAKPELLDKDSLIGTLAVSKSTEVIPPTTYLSEIYKMVNTEFEKYILDRQDLDTTIKNCQEKAQKIIDSNK